VAGVSKRLRNPCLSSADSTKEPQICAMHNLDIASLREARNSGERRTIAEKEPMISTQKTSVLERTVRGRGSGGHDDVRAIESADPNHAKKSFDDTKAFLKKLRGVKSLDMALSSAERICEVCF
jgi:hypothetical protein